MSVLKQIHDHIRTLPRGTAVTSRMFAPFGSRGNINDALSHLEHIGLLERTGLGVYRRPLEDPAEPAVLLTPTREQVQQYIETHFPTGQPFTLADLAALGPRQYLQPILWRLTHNDTLRRLSFGIYVRPSADGQQQASQPPVSGSEQFQHHLETHVPRGQPFTADTFGTILTRKRIQILLRWMTSTGQITRVRRGVYIRPLEGQAATEALPPRR